MRTKKPSTLQQKLGFLDDDLKKPKHDDMLLWFDQNAQTILDELFSKPLTDEDYSRLLKEAISKKESVIQDRKNIIESLESQIAHSKDTKFPFALSNESSAQMAQQIEAERKKISYLESWTAFEELLQRPKISIISKTWELPVTTHSNNPNNRSSKYTVGFIDMAISFYVYHPFVTGFVDERKNEKWIGDIKDRIKIAFSHQQLTVYIEAKTEVSSLGELIRQIRHYKEYLQGQYFVLCPDEKHAMTLKEQQIGFIKYAEQQ